MTTGSSRFHPRFHRITISLVLLAAGLAFPAQAIDQGELSPGELREAQFPAGETHEWTLDLAAGQRPELVVDSQQDLGLVLYSPSGELFGDGLIDSTLKGEESVSWAVSEAGTWTVRVGGFQQPAEYSIRWTEAQSPKELFVGALLDFLSRTLFPFLALLAVQGITVFFVLRFMMRPAKTASENSLPPDDTVEAPRVAGGADLGFLEAGSSSGIVLTGHSYERLQHTLRAAKRMLWGYGLSQFGFLIVSLIVAGSAYYLAQNTEVPLPIALFVLGVQAAITLILFTTAFGRYQTTGDPVSVSFAVLTVLLLLVPALVAARFGDWLSLMLWPVLPALLWWLLKKGGRRASAHGKQDLLVLRVFGSDENAVSTFRTLSRSWRYLGPIITIADPSYVRYEFSATNKGNRWRMILTSAAFFVAALAFTQPEVQAIFAGLPGLEDLKEPELFQVARIAAIVLLLPAAVLPVFVSVWRRFTKDRETLLRKINRAMGAKMRWNGVYQRRPYYCHDDLWRPAVQQMMREAEVVLMDFRGFDPSNRGCEYEIGKLIDTVPIHRCVLLLDDKTDHQGILEIFRGRWADMASDSPNRDATTAQLKVFTARPFVSWRDGIWTWLKSLPYRERRWTEDAERILAFIATAPEEQGAKAIPTNRFAATQIDPAAQTTDA